MSNQGQELMRIIIDAFSFTVVEVCREAETASTHGNQFSRTRIASNLRAAARESEANATHGQTAATILRNIASRLDSGNPPVAPVPFL